MSSCYCHVLYLSFCLFISNFCIYLNLGVSWIEGLPSYCLCSCIRINKNSKLFILLGLIKIYMIQLFYHIFSFSRPFENNKKFLISDIQSNDFSLSLASVYFQNCKATLRSLSRTSKFT